MAFAAPLSATEARGMCAEHVLGVISSGVLRRAEVELLRVIFDINMRV